MVSKKVFFLFVLIFLLVGCKYDSLKGKILDYIESCQDISKCVVRLQDMTPFDWDMVFVKGIGPSEQDVINILGSYYDKFCLGCGQLVFYKDGELVFVDTYYVISFNDSAWDLDINTGKEEYLILTPKQAIFKVEKMDSRDAYMLYIPN